MILLCRFHLLGWLAASHIADRLWSAARDLAHWTGGRALRAEFRLAIAQENQWPNAPMRDGGQRQ
jgi:hypothetical protein